MNFIINLKKLTQFYFKRFFQLFFIILYGKIDGVIKANSSEKISIKKIKLSNVNYNVYQIKGGRLYTDRINDTAIILDNKIIEGPSYQLRSNPEDATSPRNNSQTKFNIVFSKGTPRIKKSYDKSILSLLSGGGANKNYFHWLFDVLPRIGIIEKINKIDFPNYLLCPNYELPYQIDTLRLLGIQKERIISSKKNRHIESKKLLITDHPYNISGNASVDHENIPIWISDWLKEKFLKFKSNKHKFEKIYIDRSDVDPNNISLRRIQNELETKKFLEMNGYKSVKLQDLSFVEQVGLFSSVKKVIGLHGAGFANIVFCKPGTKIIEIRTRSTFKIIESIATRNKLDFKYLEYNSVDSSDKQNGIINISLDVLNKII